MKLLARLVLLGTGCVHLSATFAGRLASHLGADLAWVLGAEAAGALLGLVLAAMIFSLGRRRRPPALRALSDRLCCRLGLVWLILAILPLLGFSATFLWLAGAAVWLPIVLAGALTYLLPGSPRGSFHWPDE